MHSHHAFNTKRKILSELFNILQHYKLKKTKPIVFGYMIESFMPLSQHC